MLEPSGPNFAPHPNSETEVLNPDESGQTTAGLEELDGIQSGTEGGSDDGH